MPNSRCLACLVRPIWICCECRRKICKEHEAALDKIARYEHLGPVGKLRKFLGFKREEGIKRSVGDPYSDIYRRLFRELTGCSCVNSLITYTYDYEPKE